MTKLEPALKKHEREVREDFQAQIDAAYASGGIAAAQIAIDKASANHHHELAGVGGFVCLKNYKRDS